jgi:hypothetical protein
MEFSVIAIIIIIIIISCPPVEAFPSARRRAWVRHMGMSCTRGWRRTRRMRRVRRAGRVRSSPATYKGESIWEEWIGRLVVDSAAGGTVGVECRHEVCKRVVLTSSWWLWRHIDIVPVFK